MRSSLPLSEQFWEKADVRGPDECWEWRGVRFVEGDYGRLVRRGKNLRAHRVAYELSIGPIPPGLDVLHTCDNPPCINPAHLWVGTDADNHRDRMLKGRNRVQDGERNSNVKLTAEQVAEIRERYAAGERQTALAREFGIKQPHVSRIVRGVAW